MSRAFVFPGQGAQTIGMGRELADAYPAANQVFQEVDEALGEPLSQLIWEGDIDTLTLTQNAQPALMATSMAAMRALDAEGITISQAAFVAGHSLGEYSALAAAGALSVPDAARLLRLRGKAMQEAVPVASARWRRSWVWIWMRCGRWPRRPRKVRFVRLPMITIPLRWSCRGIKKPSNVQPRLPRQMAPSARFCFR